MSASHPSATPASPAQRKAIAATLTAARERPCVIEHGAHFQGLLAFDATARVAGRVYGRVVGAGLLEIAAGGEVEGDVRARIIVVSGQLSGDVRAEERIVVAPGGKLRGQIETAGLEVGDGAIVDGPVTMKVSTELGAHEDGA